MWRNKMLREIILRVDIERWTKTLIFRKKGDIKTTKDIEEKQTEQVVKETKEKAPK